MDNFGKDIARNLDTELVITAQNGATALVKAEVLGTGGIRVNGIGDDNPGNLQSTGTQHGTVRWRFKTDNTTHLIGFNVMVTPGMAQDYTLIAELRQGGQTVWRRTHLGSSPDRRPQAFAFSANIS